MAIDATQTNEARLTPFRKQWDIAAILAIVVTIFVGLAILTPYVWAIPEKNQNLITQGQSTLFNGWMLILAFFYKSRSTNPVDSETMATQAKTAKQAIDALTPSTADSVKLDPGEQVKVQAKDKDA
jgi:hypothetical protein